MGGSPLAKIGVITSQKGVSGRIGSGILASINYGFVRFCENNPVKIEDFEIVEVNDFADAATACDCAHELSSDDVLAIVGPSDSQAAQRVLSDPSLASVPFIITFATASHLSALGSNMFRTTNSDKKRASELVLKIRKEGAFKPRITHFALASPPGSYSDGLRQDIEQALIGSGLQFDTIEFARFEDIDYEFSKHWPIIISAPSSEASDLIRKARGEGHRGNIFGFGSNTNFLHKSCIGVVVISDIDRASDEPRVAEELERFEERYPRETEQSLASMNGAYALADAILKSQVDGGGEILAERKKLTEYLSKSTLQGMFGPLSFDQQGDLVGHEYLSILQVVSSDDGPHFSKNIDLKGNLPPTVRDHFIRWALAAWPRFLVVAALVGLLAAIVGLLVDVPALIYGGSQG